ncbi:MAG: capsular polysaccharide biosynthesis protein [Caulobacteraceae bacterium]
MSANPSQTAPAAGHNRFRATLVPAWGVGAIPHLEAFLPECAQLVRRIVPGGETDSVAGWGFNRTARYARFLADRLGKPYLALEDGFLRSVGLGGAGAPPMSLVVDDLGVCYDARSPSRLETILQQGDLDDPALAARGRSAIERIIAAGLSKTNAAPPFSWPGRARGRRRVLVVDQTAGDASIAGAMADQTSFTRMLEAALDEERGAQILVRRHPAVAAGLKRGCLPRDLPAGVGTVDADARPADILAGVDSVYTVSSLLGFEALIRGLAVRCFGLPFWAGWGASSDELSTPRRARRLSAEQIFRAAYVLYPRYVDPLTGEACGIETAIERLIAFRAAADRQAGFTAAAGFAPWKHGPARTLLYSPRGRVKFYPTVEGARAAAERGEGRVVFWAGREKPTITAALAAAKAPVIRMEDGFLRSRGLGSDFHPAASSVLDDLGMYYDPTAPSRLERILETTDFAPALLVRAAALRERLVAGGLTKYNLAKPAATLDWPADRRRLLVVGQVENDKSLEKGCEAIATNLALLEAARRDHPDAFIAFKPHPDVEAGNRPGAIAKSEAERLADALATEAGIAACLAVCDGLVTMTSLAGFEALLRGKPVITYGRPFYAGWGLTRDALAIDRRHRRLTLDELVAGTLILYPIYVDPMSGLPCEVEHLAEVLAADAPAPAPRRWRYLRAIAESLAPAARARY